MRIQNDETINSSTLVLTFDTQSDVGNTYFVFITIYIDKHVYEK